jgi:uncharacterized membrane protein YciS (DUF1049 family)
MAVAANIVALVTGMVWLRMAKKVAEAERFIKRGTECCQIERRGELILERSDELKAELKPLKRRGSWLPAA